MTHPNLTTERISTFTLTKCLAIGGGIGLIIMSIFLMGVNNPQPEWGKFWMIRPLVVITLAGATGGAFFYMMDQLNVKRGLNMGVVVVLSLIVYIIGIWIGSVLGLAGTLWN